MTNKTLFSQHYLDNRLSAQPEWNEDPLAVLEQVRLLWQKAQQYSASWNEAQTEDEFIRPILVILGWSFVVQAKASRAGQITRPDYALFADEKSKQQAYKYQGDDDAFYSRALAIAEAKHWGRPLSQKDSSGKATWKAESNPSHQMVSYLVGTRAGWGVLTNGRTWRLYSREVSSTASEFYEFELGDIFDFLPVHVPPSPAQIEHFRRWWLFFRRAAFTWQAGAKPFVERVHDGSAMYAREISEKLKELVFEEVMPEIAGGFVAYRYHQLGIREETPETLDEIYRASLSLLYKLLFLLYAEARSLLPMENPDYRANSLTSMAQWAAEQSDSKRWVSDSTYATPHYDALLALFRRVDRGDASLGIPHYNGGLFSPNSPENRFLESHKLSDRAVAQAVDVLVRDKGQPVDYAYISVRNLGAIYEGLLENKLKVVEAAAGAVELVNDKGERKATGSFYTPDYIVEYIVENTLAPILQARRADYERAMGRVAGLRQKLLNVNTAAIAALLRAELEEAERQALEAFLGIKVLDPAMGSGHFLVNAVDHLTDGIILCMQTYHDAHPEALWEWDPIQQLIERVRSDILDEMRGQGLNVDARRLDDTALLTRLVMKRCIYGVDLNPMAVELAKVSLWLHSFTVGAPLSFLDHHLRWGNSLIGVWDIGKYIVPGTERWNDVNRTLAAMVQISDMTDSTLGEVARSSSLYKESRTWVKPTIERLNVEMAAYFTEWGKNQKTLAQVAQLAYQPDEIRQNEPGLFEKYQQAQQMAVEKRFFHWKLEFPEVFVDLHLQGWAQDAGFDALIGNPPYVDVAADDYYKNSYRCQSSRNLYAYILERSVQVLRPDGRLGKIVPLSLVCADRMDVLRNWLKQTSTDISVANFGIRPSKIFPNVDQRVTIIFASKKNGIGQNTNIRATRFHRWNPGDEHKMIKSLSYVDITDIDQKLGWAKLGDETGRKIFTKIFLQQTGIKDYFGGSWTCYYHGIGRYWLKAYTFIPTYLKENGEQSRSSTLFDLSFTSEKAGKLILALMNSSLFFWYWVLFGDDFHLTRSLIENFPFTYKDSDSNKVYDEIEKNVDLLMKDYQDKSILKRGKYATGTITWQEFYPRRSKQIIDKLDDLFGMLYGLTPGEVSYIKNFDIEFRTDEEE